MRSTSRHAQRITDQVGGHGPRLSFHRTAVRVPADAREAGVRRARARTRRAARAARAGADRRCARRTGPGGSGGRQDRAGPGVPQRAPGPAGHPGQRRRGRGHCLLHPGRPALRRRGVARGRAAGPHRAGAAGRGTDRGGPPDPGGVDPERCRWAGRGRGRRRALGRRRLAARAPVRVAPTGCATRADDPGGTVGRRPSAHRPPPPRRRPHRGHARARTADAGRRPDAGRHPDRGARPGPDRAPAVRPHAGQPPARARAAGGDAARPLAGLGARAARPPRVQPDDRPPARGLQRPRAAVRRGGRRRR